MIRADIISLYPTAIGAFKQNKARIMHPVFIFSDVYMQYVDYVEIVVMPAIP